MNKLLLTIVTLISAGSLHGMEWIRHGQLSFHSAHKNQSTTTQQDKMANKQQLDSNVDYYSRLSPITLPQTYHQLSKLLTEASEDSSNSFTPLVQHILSLQLDNIDPAKLPLEIEQRCKNIKTFAQYFETLIKSCGYKLSVELLKKYFPCEKISICNVKDHLEHKHTMLHWAVANGHAEIAQLFLNAAGDKAQTLLAMQTDQGESALHYATVKGTTEIAQLLLDAAGNNAGTLLTMQTNQGLSALYFATYDSNTEMVKLLLNTAGNTVLTLLTMQETKDHWTALHLASYNGNTEIVKLLLNAAGDQVWTLLTMRSIQTDWTALYWAAHFEFTEIMKLLLDAADDKAKDLMVMKAIIPAKILGTDKDKEITIFDANSTKVQDILKQYM